MDEASKLLLLAEIDKLSQRFDELGKRMDARFAKWEQQPAFPSAPTPSPSSTSTTAASPAAAASTTTFCEASLSCSDSEGTMAQPFSVEKVVTTTTPSRCSTVCRSADVRELVPMSTTAAAMTTLSDTVVVVPGRKHAAAHHISVEVSTINNSPTRLFPAPEALVEQVPVEQFAKGVDLHEFIDGGSAASRPRRAPPRPPRPRRPRQHRLCVPRLRRPRRTPPRAPRPRRSRRASLRVLRFRHPRRGRLRVPRFRRPRRAPPRLPQPRRPRRAPQRVSRPRRPRRVPSRPNRPPRCSSAHPPWRALPPSVLRSIPTTSLCSTTTSSATTLCHTNELPRAVPFWCLAICLSHEVGLLKPVNAAVGTAPPISLQLPTDVSLDSSKSCSPACSHVRYITNSQIAYSIDGKHTCLATKAHNEHNGLDQKIVLNSVVTDSLLAILIDKELWPHPLNTLCFSLWPLINCDWTTVLLRPLPWPSFNHDTVLVCKSIGPYCQSFILGNSSAIACWKYWLTLMKSAVQGNNVPLWPNPMYTNTCYAMAVKLESFFSLILFDSASKLTLNCEFSMQYCKQCSNALSVDGFTRKLLLGPAQSILTGINSGQWMIVVILHEFLQFKYYWFAHHWPSPDAQILASPIAQFQSGNNLLLNTQLSTNIGQAILVPPNASELFASCLSNQENSDGSWCHITCAILLLSSVSSTWTEIQVTARFFPWPMVESMCRIKRLLLLAESFMMTKIKNVIHTRYLQVPWDPGQVVLVALKICKSQEALQAAPCVEIETKFSFGMHNSLWPLPTRGRHQVINTDSSMVICYSTEFSKSDTQEDKYRCKCKHTDVNFGQTIT